MCSVNAEDIIMVFSLCKRRDLDIQNMQRKITVSLLMMVERGLETHKGQKYCSCKLKCLKLERDLQKRTE